MKIEIKTDPSVTEPKIIILADRMTEEINDIVARISAPEPKMIAGFQGDSVRILDQERIISVFSSGARVMAKTEDGDFALRLRLYELEQTLRRDLFVRISNSEIINLKKVRRFDLSIAGTICVSMSDGSTSFVSRRNVSKIKAKLGL